MGKISVKQIKTDCRHFRGDIPCKPHKMYSVHCIDNGKVCKYYERTAGRVLIIKLGAIGDVIRTTPIIHKIKEVAPQTEIWWLTNTPEIVPSIVDKILPFTVQSITILYATSFDLVYNFDKDTEACALCSILSAKTKMGFKLVDGKCFPIGKASPHKYLNGIFDDENKKNKKSYLEEIFEIAGYKFRKEKYILDNSPNNYNWNLPKNKTVIGLNTGCGGRWTSRLWPEENWIVLSRKLLKSGFIPLLLGGEREHAKNSRISKQSGAKYLGHFPLQQFISEINRCDLVVTAVTMAAHITIGLGKKIVLFNNIFNKNEFELYGLGVILEPEYKCNCYFSPVCENNCMQYLSTDKVFESIQKLLRSS